MGACWCRVPEWRLQPLECNSQAQISVIIEKSISFAWAPLGIHSAPKMLPRCRLCHCHDVTLLHLLKYCYFYSRHVHSAFRLVFRLRLTTASFCRIFSPQGLPPPANWTGQSDLQLSAFEWQLLPKLHKCFKARGTCFP